MASMNHTPQAQTPKSDRWALTSETLRASAQSRRASAQIRIAHRTDGQRSLLEHLDGRAYRYIARL